MRLLISLALLRVGIRPLGVPFRGDRDNVTPRPDGASGFDVSRELFAKSVQRRQRTREREGLSPWRRAPTVSASSRRSSASTTTSSSPPTSGRPGCRPSSVTAGRKIERRGIGEMEHIGGGAYRQTVRRERAEGRLLGLRGPGLHPQAPRRRGRLRPRRHDDVADHVRRDAPGLLRPEGPHRGQRA